MSLFEQMGCKGVAEGMGAPTFRDVGAGEGLFDGELDPEFGEVMSSNSC